MCIVCIFSAFDKWTPDPSDNVEKTPPTKVQGSSNPYVTDLPCDLFAKKYPKLVDKHKLCSNEKKGKGMVACMLTFTVQKVFCDGSFSLCI